MADERQMKAEFCRVLPSSSDVSRQETVDIAGEWTGERLGLGALMELAGALVELAGPLVELAGALVELDQHRGPLHQHRDPLHTQHSHNIPMTFM